MFSKESKIMGEILQSIIEKGWLRAWMTTSELPSRINLSKFKDYATKIANCATKASPTFAEQGLLMREDKCMAALMAVSKLIPLSKRFERGQMIFPSEFLHMAV